MKEAFQRPFRWTNPHTPTAAAHGVVRGEAHAPRADRVVEVQLPPLKPSRDHDATSMHGARISRSSMRNCLLRAMVKLSNHQVGSISRRFDLVLLLEL